MQVKTIQNLFLVLLLIIGVNAAALATATTVLAEENPALFASSETAQESSEISEQLDVVLSRYQNDRKDSYSDKDKDMEKWQSFLVTLEGKSAREQIEAVNTYANRRAYKTDKANYGTGDYWATPKEFLARGGDCEDFAIIKLLSLQKLGFNIDSLRMVVLIDTELRTPHAVLAVYIGGDVLILDNQSATVESHTTLSHYVPLYSINPDGWWMHSVS